MRARVGLIVFFLGSFLFFPTFAVAQDNFSAEQVPLVTESDVATEPASPEDVEAEIATLTEQYFSLVEAYRDTERQYVIARETYYKNNTLAAQDEAIRQAQLLMTARAKVLETYFTYLQKDLDRTLGISLEDKVLVLNRLEKLRADLQEAQKDAGKVYTRTEVSAAFTTLNAEQVELQTTAYQTLALIKIGQLQNAIDQATLSRSMVGTWLKEAQVTEASRAKKQRGLEEIDHLIQSAKNNLTEVNQNWQKQTENNRYLESAYRGFQEDAEYTYLQLRQAHAFFEEIVRSE